LLLATDCFDANPIPKDQKAPTTVGTKPLARCSIRRWPMTTT